MVFCWPSSHRLAQSPAPSCSSAHLNHAFQLIPGHWGPQWVDITLFEREIKYREGMIYETPVTKAGHAQHILKQFTTSFLSRVEGAWLGDAGMWAPFWQIGSGLCKHWEGTSVVKGRPHMLVFHQFPLWIKQPALLEEWVYGRCVSSPRSGRESWSTNSHSPPALVLSVSQ
jgi:hypothetical protein